LVTDFNKKSAPLKFMKIHPMEAKFFHMNTRLRNGMMDMRKPTVTFCNCFMNTSNNKLNVMNITGSHHCLVE
jgi:hypothetical protein